MQSCAEFSAAGVGARHITLPLSSFDGWYVCSRWEMSHFVKCLSVYSPLWLLPYWNVDLICSFYSFKLC